MNRRLLFYIFKYLVITKIQYRKGSASYFRIQRKHTDIANSVTSHQQTKVSSNEKDAKLLESRVFFEIISRSIPKSKTVACSSYVAASSFPSLLHRPQFTRPCLTTVLFSSFFPRSDESSFTTRNLFRTSGNFFTTPIINLDVSISSTISYKRWVTRMNINPTGP